MLYSLLRNGCLQSLTVLIYTLFSKLLKNKRRVLAHVDIDTDWMTTLNLTVINKFIDYNAVIESALQGVACAVTSSVCVLVYTVSFTSLLYRLLY